MDSGETVYAKISQLPGATTQLLGNEYLEVSQLGQSKKALFQDLHGSGWFETLKAPLVSFKAPDSTHADSADSTGHCENADTLGESEETPANFHDASRLTGTLPVTWTGEITSLSDFYDTILQYLPDDPLGVQCSGGWLGTYEGHAATFTFSRIAQSGTVVKLYGLYTTAPGVGGLAEVTLQDTTSGSVIGMLCF